jgi:hypothetical protein
MSSSRSKLMSSNDFTDTNIRSISAAKSIVEQTLLVFNKKHGYILNQFSVPSSSLPPSLHSFLKHSKPKLHCAPSFGTSHSPTIVFGFELFLINLWTCPIQAIEPLPLGVMLASVRHELNVALLFGKLTLLVNSFSF